MIEWNLTSNLKRFSIRPVEAGDVAEVARVHIQCWRESYRDIIDPGFLDKMSFDRHAALWARIVGEKSAAFIAESDDAIVGLANGGRYRNHSFGTQNDQAEIYTLYVLTQAHRIGIGRALFDATHFALASSGYSGLLIKVLTANPACSFYERLGGTRSGTVNVEIGRQFLEEAVYQWYD